MTTRAVMSCFAGSSPTSASRCAAFPATTTTPQPCRATCGHLAPAQLQLLDRALATATTPVLVCLHHHPVPMSSDWLDRIGLGNAQAFWSIIDAYRCVRGVLWGHVHQSFDGLRRGVRLLATPSTCAQFLPHAHEFAIDSQPPAFRTLELQPDGSLITDLYWVDACGTGSLHSASSAA
jgi:Icc protein